MTIETKTLTDGTQIRLSNYGYQSDYFAVFVKRPHDRYPTRHEFMRDKTAASSFLHNVKEWKVVMDWAYCS